MGCRVPLIIFTTLGMGWPKTCLLLQPPNLEMNRTKKQKTTTIAKNSEVIGVSQYSNTGSSSREASIRVPFII